jgi:hypothetical protein
MLMVYVCLIRIIMPIMTSPVHQTINIKEGKQFSVLVGSCMRCEATHRETGSIRNHMVITLPRKQYRKYPDLPFDSAHDFLNQ